MASNQRKSNEPKNTAPKKKDKGGRRTTAIWIFSFIILVVIVVTFIGAPAISGTAGGNKMVFGSYAGHEIVYSPGNYLDHQKNLIAQRLRDSGQDTNSQSALYQVWRSAFINTAFHEAVMIQAQKSGLVVSESAIDQQIAQDPQFLDQNGQFSIQKYNQSTTADKYRLRGYLRQELVQQEYINDELNGLHFSAAAEKFVADMSSPERRFNLVSYSYADFPESKVIEYGKANDQKFERINLSVITLHSNESEAKAIHEQLVNKTASFADLARAHSADMYANKGGDMGWTHYYELATDFSDPTVLNKVFALKAGEISGVLKTTYGWVIYQVNDPAQKPDFSNKDTLKTIRDYMNSFQRGIIEDYLVAQEKDIKKNAEKSDLAGAAQAAGKSISLTDFFPVNYGNEPLFPSVKAVEPKLPVASGASREDFFRKLFELKGTQISDPIVLGDHVMIFQMADERTAPADAVKKVETNFPLAAQKFQSQDVQSAIFDTNLLVDNFNQIFSKYLYTPQKQ